MFVYSWTARERYYWMIERRPTARSYIAWRWTTHATCGAAGGCAGCVLHLLTPSLLSRPRKCWQTAGTNGNTDASSRRQGAPAASSAPRGEILIFRRVDRYGAEGAPALCAVTRQWREQISVVQPRSADVADTATSILRCTLDQLTLSRTYTIELAHRLRSLCRYTICIGVILPSTGFTNVEALFDTNVGAGALLALSFTFSFHFWRSFLRTSCKIW